MEFEPVFREMREAGSQVREEESLYLTKYNQGPMLPAGSRQTHPQPHRFMPSFFRPAALVLTFSPALLFAAEPPKKTTEEPAPFSLGTIEVVADSLKKAAGPATGTIDARDIRAFERLDLGEALRLTPGVVASNNGPRNESGVSVRGFDLRQVPVFIDGVPVYVPYDGYVDLHRFTTADVAQINVDKGFSSTLFGPNTMGGAINVITRRPERPLEGDIMAGWLENGGYQSALNLGSRQKDWYYQVGASYLDVDSFPLSHDFDPTTRENGGARDNSYRKDWRISAKIGYTPNETDEYALGYVQQSGEKGNPVYTGTDPLAPVRYWQWPEWSKQTLYFISETKIGETGYVKPRLYYDWYQNSLFAYDNATYTTQTRPSSFRSYYDDYTYGASVEAGFKPADNNTLKAAVHGKLDHHEEHNAGAPFYTFEDTTWSFGIEDTHKFNDQWSLVAGASYDVRDVREAVDTNTGADLGGNTTHSFNPQAGVFYNLPGDAGAFHVSVAKKSRFPTVKDRYSYRMGQALPNPDLDPESAIHYELGYSGKVLDSLTIRASIFDAEVSDTIQRVDNVAPGRFQLQNIGDSRNRGFETGFDYTPSSNVRIGASYTYLDRENNAQPQIRLLDSPRHSLIGYADLRPVEWLSVIPTVEYGSERYSTTYGVKAGSYVVAGLKLELHLPEELTLSAGVNNIFDRDYELTEGYPEAGRSFYVNLQKSF